MSERKRKILFFIESFSGGGAERVLYTVLKYIDRKKYDITVLVMSDCGAQREAFHKLGIRIVNVLSHKIGILNKIKYKLLYNYLPAKIAAKWLLNGIKADSFVAFVEGYCTKIFSTISSEKHKTAWVHTDLKKYPWPVEKGIFGCHSEEQEAYLGFNEVIGVSKEVTTVMKREYGITNAKTIYNPIDEIRIRKLSNEPCCIQIDKKSLNLISVGRLTPPKGYDLLIGILPEIVMYNPNTKLYIVGDGEERGLLEAQIKRLGLQDHVILTGFLQNPYSLMAQMDLFVCSSRAEGFSLVIAEAMTVGLPIISMECAGPCELLDNGRYGILCKSYDDLAKSIMKVSEDKVLLKSLRAKSRQRAKDFNTERTIKLIEDIL